MNTRLLCHAGVMALLGISSVVHAASWGSVEKTWGVGWLSIQGSWGWPSEDDTTPICHVSRCIVTVGSYDPRGAYPYGSINRPFGMNTKIYIPLGATTKQAWEIWKQQYGVGPSQWVQSPMFASGSELSQTCYGFQVFQTVSVQMLGTLLPGTTCGLVPPPNLTCDVYLGSEINLGVVPKGTSGVSGGVDGSVTCSSSATIYSSLLNRPVLDGNVVAISVNGVKLDNQVRSVGTGQQVPLNVVANIEGKLDNAGVYETSTILLFSYQ